MRIAVMGTGGTGGFFGGLLARAGADVTFIARGVHLDAIQQRGLTVKSQLVGDFQIPARATRDPRQIGMVDLVLFCVKAFDTDAAAQLIRPLVGAQTVVLSVQNGIDNEMAIGRVVGSERVIGAVAGVTALIEAPGTIAQMGRHAFVRLGELAGGTGSRIEQVAQTLRAAGIAVELHDDIQRALWEKFLLICGLSGMTALTRLPIGVIAACPESAEMLRTTVAEVAAVGRAAGIPLAPGCVDEAMGYLTSTAPSVYGSMYYDLAAGRRLELEYLNGKVVALGREHDIPTPMNLAIYAALKPFGDGSPAPLC
jgi:2-dehydropantoate 2-reductase